MADVDELSMTRALPRLVELERRFGSVTRGLRRGRTGPNGPAQVALASGMESLIERLVARISGWALCSLRLRAQVTALRQSAPGRGFNIELASGDVLTVEAVLFARPAPDAALALEPCDPALAAAIRGLGTTACATVSLTYERARLARPLRSFGCFLPRGEPLPIVAATFASEKFEGRAPADRLLVRVFMGGARRPDLLEQSDSELVAGAHDSVAGLLGMAAAQPLHSRVFRHPAAMPRFVVGHGERVAGLRSLLARQPGLLLAGSSLGAYGIPDCIATAREAAEAILELCRRERGGEQAASRPALAASAGRC